MEWKLLLGLSRVRIPNNCGLKGKQACLLKAHRALRVVPRGKRSYLIDAGAEDKVAFLVPLEREYGSLVLA